MLWSEKAKVLTGAAFFALAKGADTPVSLGMWLRFKYGEFRQLVEKDINPADYTSADAFYRDYVVTKYLSKYVGLPTGIDLDATAKAAWEAAELQCKQTNISLRELQSAAHADQTVESVIATARWKIGTLLGGMSWMKALEGCRWGPGATFTLKGTNATVVDKIRLSPVDVTVRALPLLKAVIESDPHWVSAMLRTEVVGPVSLLPVCFEIVPGCRGTLVPKSAKTHRSIAIEPTGNIFLQLGVGRYFRRCLKRVGVDLNDQTRNQALAQQGSLTGSLVTLDLKAASDTVSTELVHLLFPTNVANLLDLLRSPNISWKKGTWRKLEKFSSMGNGFTFELESLIFWALTDSCRKVVGCREPIGIYGDDIVCSARVAPLLTEVLRVCGFSLNQEKSHVTGHFRESCGSHYWAGCDVTPIYQKENPDSLPELYRAANRLYRAYLRGYDDQYDRISSWLRGAWHVYVSGVAKALGYNGPPVHTDLLIREISQRRGHAVPLRAQDDDGLMLPLGKLDTFVLDRSVDGWLKLPVLSFRPQQKTAEGRAMLAYWLRFTPDTPLKGRIPVRRRGRYLSRRRVYYLWHLGDPGTLDVAW